MDDNGPGVGPSSGGPASTTIEVPSSQGLSDHTQQRIGLHLRAMYDTIVQQPVPDRFRDLIARLDASATDAD